MEKIALCRDNLWFDTVLYSIWRGKLEGTYADLSIGAIIFPVALIFVLFVLKRMVKKEWNICIVQL